jgi:hypothetical protein
MLTLRNCSRGRSFGQTRHKLREELIGSCSRVIHTALPLYAIRRLFSWSAVGFIAKAPEDKGVRSNSPFATQQHLSAPHIVRARTLSGTPAGPNQDRPLTLTKCGQGNEPLILDPSRFEPGSVFDIVPAQLNLAFEPEGVELDSARRREINHILFARIGQAVRLVGRPVCQKLGMWRAVKGPAPSRPLRLP